MLSGTSITAFRRLSVLLVTVIVGCGSGDANTTAVQAPSPSIAQAAPCGASSRPPRRYDHVVWVVMENQFAGSVIGARDAPYANRLAAECGSARNFRAETHPSLPNYIAMTSGSTHGIVDDAPPESHPLSGSSIFSQLGTHWRALEESMQANCAQSSAGEYAVRHNPAAYFTDVRHACVRQDIPLRTEPDLSARFTFVTPNLCNDTHDCPVATGDRWLRAFLGKVFASADYRRGETVVFVTWDEDDGRHGNRIPTLVAARSMVPGTTARQPFNHYSLLRTTEDMLGLRFLGNAARAVSMRPAFGI